MCTNRFKVAFSFPGEHRSLVHKIADGLSEDYGENFILYDEFHRAEFARPNLDTYLQKLYKEESELIIVFICDKYNNKEWCGIEWRAIRELLNSKKADDRIMFIKCGEGSVDGLFGTIDGYIDSQKISIDDIISDIKKRYSSIYKKNDINTVIDDLAKYYNTVGEKGIDNYLNEKHIKNMTQKEINLLFKSLWEYVFIRDEKAFNENRESYYCILEYLFNMKETHFIELINKDEEFFFNKIELETYKSWCEKHDVEPPQIYYFNKYSRIAYLIKLNTRNPIIFKALNDYLKNVLLQSINVLYTKANLAKDVLYRCGEKDSALVAEQIRLKSKILFLSNNPFEHFDSIIRMVKNFMYTSEKWVEPSHYPVLSSDEIETIYRQSKTICCLKEFAHFLIDYTTGAQQYNQVNSLFNILITYEEHFDKDMFHLILAKMNVNSQYYDNHDINSYLKQMEKIYFNRFGKSMINSVEENWLYRKLYLDKWIEPKKDYDIIKMMELIEERALHYENWELASLLYDLVFYDDKNYNLFNERTCSSYLNIHYVFRNRENLDLTRKILDFFFLNSI